MLFQARKVFPDFERFAVEYIFRKICEIVDRQKSDKIYFKKIEIVGKTRQNPENKQTFDLTGKIEIEVKTRQSAENKQTFDLTGKLFATSV